MTNCVNLANDFDIKNKNENKIRSYTQRMKLRHKGLTLGQGRKRHRGETRTDMNRPEIREL